MKIAILTLPLYTNYGGILQNFALQQVLKNIGYEVETLNIEWNDVSLSFRIKSSASSFVNAILGKIDWKNVVLPHKTDKMRWIKSMHNLTEHVQPSIQQSPIITSHKQLVCYVEKNKFDAFVVGSDQVWRPQYLPNVPWFYLSFLPRESKAKRIAYAASFGTSEWEYTIEQTQQVKPLAQLFHAISVREESGVELCKKNLGVSAKAMLDPTMLLTVKDYQEQVDNAIEFTYSMKDSVFSYVLDNATDKQLVMRKIATIVELPVQRLAYNDNAYLKIVNQWLRGFSEATCVVTDSFHGTVFSILFHCPFVVIVNKGRGVARMQTLLRTFGLEDRMVDSAEGLDKEWMLSSINWKRVDKILDEKREEAMTFLKSALS